jgi:hypothetical protein
MPASFEDAFDPKENVEKVGISARRRRQLLAPIQI